jgi:hypothetical protein
MDLKSSTSGVGHLRGASKGIGMDAPLFHVVADSEAGDGETEWSWQMPGIGARIGTTT